MKKKDLALDIQDLRNVLGSIISDLVDIKHTLYDTTETLGLVTQSNNWNQLLNRVANLEKDSIRNLPFKTPINIESNKYLPSEIHEDIESNKYLPSEVQINTELAEDISSLENYLHRYITPSKIQADKELPEKSSYTFRISNNFLLCENLNTAKRLVVGKYLGANNRLCLRSDDGEWVPVPEEFLIRHFPSLLQ